MAMILTVVGARPQFIKAAPVSRALRAAGLNEILVHTGQHFDDAMSALFFTELSIPPPAYNLGINSLGQGAMTGRMLEQLEQVMLTEKPRMVLGLRRHQLDGSGRASRGEAANPCHACRGGPAFF